MYKSIIYQVLMKHYTVILSGLAFLNMFSYCQILDTFSIVLIMVVKVQLGKGKQPNIYEWILQP